MPIYSDALLDDEELANIINAIRLNDDDTSRPTPVTSPSRSSIRSPVSPPLGVLRTDRPHPSHADHRVYNVSSGTETGMVEEWSRAAHATQGVPGGKARRIQDETGSPFILQVPSTRGSGQSTTQTPYTAPARRIQEQCGSPGAPPVATTSRPMAPTARSVIPPVQSAATPAPSAASAASMPRVAPAPSSLVIPRRSNLGRRRGRKTYVVFEGLRTGLFDTWEEVKPLVTRIPGNVHSSFSTRRDAERAYALAYALGSVRVLKHPNDPTPGAPAPAAAMPTDVMRAWEQVGDDFLEAEWHVVFKGRRTGVFPSWNFAATQTIKIRCASYQKYSTRAAAQAAYDRAVERGEVETL